MTVKWRVIASNKGVYKPQYRFLWIWCDVHPEPEYLASLTFDTMPKAREWVKNQLNSKTKWHIAEKYYD